MKRNNGIIGSLQGTTIDDAGGVHDIYDAHLARYSNNWPRAELYVSLTPSTTTVSEGNSMTFTLVTEHITNGTTLYYTISTVSGTTMNDDDFTDSPGGGGVDGSFTTTNDSTTLTFALEAEFGGVTENNVFKLQIRTGSTSGPVVIESSNITVTDVVGTGTDIRSAFYEISNRIIVDTTSADYTGAYDVGEVQQSYTGSARIYLVFKCTTSTTFVNDICVAAVQVLNSSNVVQQTWNWSGGTNQSWQDNGSRILGNSNLLSSYYTPANAAALTYGSITAGGANTRVGITSATSSTFTGMADGIASGTGTAYTVGNGTVAQSASTSYIYGEVSGATRYSHVIARSPSYSFSASDKIRVVHGVVTSSAESSSLNINDSLWIGIR